EPLAWWRMGLLHRDICIGILTMMTIVVDECHSAWKIRLELDEIVKFFAQAGIIEVHFLFFNPESSVFLILIKELIEKADGFARVFLGVQIQMDSKGIDTKKAVTGRGK
nr:hypothetical protein [Tanacetum cinerariifolium]